MSRRRVESRSDVFAAIADPTRRRILEALASGEQPVGALARPFAMSLPAVSQHLKALLKAGLVVPRREGRQRFFRLDPRPLEEVADWVSHYERFWQKKLRALGKYLDKEKP